MSAMATRQKKEDEAAASLQADAAPAPPERRVRARNAGGDRGPLDSLVDGLDEIVPGISVLDSELAFEGGARADLAAVDPSGRLHLVLVAGEDADRAALEALDALGVLRTQLELFVRHFGEGRINPERSPRVLVVSPGTDTRLAERLAPLADAGVSVLGLRTMRSRAGERSYLVKLDTGGRTAAASTGTAAFLRGLPSRLEALGNALVERMQRLDEELTPTADATTVVWRLADEVLVRVERIGDLLQASVAPRHEPLPLGDLADLERLTEKVYARLVRVLNLTRGEEPLAPLEPGAARGDGRREAQRDEPLLTPEEIQAFRE
jgi:hypothetical protein